MFKKILIGAAAVLSVAGATLATSTPAMAYGRGGYGGYHGGYYRGGYGGGVALGAGLLGLAVGASLARPYYGAPPGYYNGPGYWGSYGGCRGYWRWDPILGPLCPGGPLLLSGRV